MKSEFKRPKKCIFACNTKLMISFLIPTYNYNVFPLANQIEKQAKALGIAFELICVDDGSLSIINKENKKINTLANCRFIEAKNNVGLSNNRNNLVEFSKYDNLIFIDGDSILPDDFFVSRYMEAIDKNTDVIYGGRIHPKTVEPSRKLRWKYGKHHEDLSASSRKKNNYKSVLFNNTLIKKETFKKIGFEKTIKQYGHEDTIFAYHLNQIKAKIKHIDNPVLHGDVDFNAVFFFKMHKSIQNLNYIYSNKLIDPDFIPFLKIFNKLKKWKLNYLLAAFYKILKPFIRWNCISNSPSIIIFDFFRITYFCYINQKK